MPRIPFILAIASLALFSFRHDKPRPLNTTDKPNIIFILTDDQRYDALGAMGNKIIKTPHLDRLANAGILFKNAYVTTSICCVSRATLLTGQYESLHNINDFTTPLSPDALKKTCPALLKDAGYKLGFIGKYGVGKHPPDSLYDYWVDMEAGEKTQPDYVTIGRNGQPIHDTDTIGHAIQDFLDKSGNDKPFFLSVSFKAPHEQDGNPPKYIIQPRYQDYYKNVNIPSPLTAQPRYWDQLPDFFRTEDNFGRSRWRGLFGTNELFQENVKNYYRLITGVDDVVGEMVKKLEKLGITKKTIIVYMGDNGMFLGEHGMEGKWYGYEESIRVPLLIYDPTLPVKLQKYKASQIVLNLDIAPTILAMAGVVAPKTMQGVNLLDVLQNKISAREDFFYQHYFLGSPHIPKVEGLVTKRFKYMNFIEHNYEELYDISGDPHETTNLAGDPKYKPTMEKMKTRFEVVKKSSQ